MRESLYEGENTALRHIQNHRRGIVSVYPESVTMSASTHAVKRFLKDQQRTREADNQQRLSSKQTEEDALHCRGHDQLRDANQTVCLLA